MSAVTSSAAIACERVVLNTIARLPWPPEGAEAISSAAWGLLDAIGLHDAVASGALHWEHIDPDLWIYAEPETEALAKQAEEVKDAARRLTEVFRHYCGTEVTRVAREAAMAGQGESR